MYPARIFICGLSGAGKTTCGRVLARRIGYEFVDTDDEIERSSGKSVGRIFSEEGEDCFRQWERKIVRLTGDKSGVVVALGGGALSDKSNSEMILANGYLIYLRVSPESASVRLVDAADRPLLSWLSWQSAQMSPAGDDLTIQLRHMLSERESQYRLAHSTVDGDQATPKEVAQRILAVLKRHEQA